MATANISKGNPKEGVPIVQTENGGGISLSGRVYSEWCESVFLINHTVAKHVVLS